MIFEEWQEKIAKLHQQGYIFLRTIHTPLGRWVILMISLIFPAKKTFIFGVLLLKKNNIKKTGGGVGGMIFQENIHPLIELHLAISLLL